MKGRNNNSAYILFDDDHWGIRRQSKFKRAFNALQVFMKHHWWKVLIGALLATAIVVAGVFTGGAVPAIALGVAAGLGVTYAVGTGLGVAAVAAGAFAVGAFISAMVCKLVEYVRVRRSGYYKVIVFNDNNDEPLVSTPSPYHSSARIRTGLNGEEVHLLKDGSSETQPLIVSYDSDSKPTFFSTCQAKARELAAYLQNQFSSSSATSTKSAKYPMV